MSDRPELRIDPTSIISTGAIANVSGAYSVEAAGGEGPVCLHGEGVSSCADIISMLHQDLNPMPTIVGSC